MSVKNNILLYKEKNNVAYLTLNRPKAQNALSSDQKPKSNENVI